MYAVYSGVCVCGKHHHHATKQSIQATIRPFHAKARAKWGVHAQTVRAIDLSYVIWNDFCVIISLVLSDPDKAWNECVCVCLCVSSGMMCVPLYLTSVTQRRLFNMLSQWEGYTPVCVWVCTHYCVWVTGSVFSVKTCFFLCGFSFFFFSFFFLRIIFTYQFRIKSGEEPRRAEECWVMFWICDTYITTEREREREREKERERERESCCYIEWMIW